MIRGGMRSNKQRRKPLAHIDVARIHMAVAMQAKDMTFAPIYGVAGEVRLGGNRRMSPTSARIFAALIAPTPLMSSQQWVAICTHQGANESDLAALYARLGGSVVMAAQ